MAKLSAVEIRANTLVPLKTGITETFTARDRTFEVKRLNHDTWHLRDTQVRTTSRFGTLPQIREDVVHALEVGRLPPPVGGRW